MLETRIKQEAAKCEQLSSMVKEYEKMTQVKDGQIKEHLQTTDIGIFDLNKSREAINEEVNTLQDSLYDQMTAEAESLHRSVTEQTTHLTQKTESLYGENEKLNHQVSLLERDLHSSTSALVHAREEIDEFISSLAEILTPNGSINVTDLFQMVKQTKERLETTEKKVRMLKDKHGN